MMKLKSVIPFSKELDFSTKISEITSISLEREFEVQETSIEGNLFVTGDYKSHEVSANVLPFSFKIPFSIEIPENLDTESITLEISDFAYDLLENSKIKVNIELELEGKIMEIVEEEEEESNAPVEVNSDEILKMMEERKEEDFLEEPIEEVEEKEISVVEETKEERKEEENAEKEERNESEDLILENVTKEDEYATYHIHMVKEGESVKTICTMYNSNISLLADYNDLTNITPGEKLIIPKNDES